MKTIGLLGGMSWESTAEYYRHINMLTRERLGGLHSAACLLYSFDFAEIEGLQAQESWSEASTLLATGAKTLETAGADAIVICTNTMHKVFDAVAASITIPILHIADATADAVLSHGLRRVGLLGTAYTMEQPFYRERLVARGLEVMSPSSTSRAHINAIIYKELCLGILRQRSRDALKTIAHDLIGAGAEGVILACTELELLLSQSDILVPTFPTAKLHAEAAVTFAIGPSVQTAIQATDAVSRYALAADNLNDPLPDTQP